LACSLRVDGKSGMPQEQLSKLQQTQQNLQMIIAQKQQLELEQLETEKALVELNKANDDDAVFKHAGTILIKSNKKDLIEELEEKKELAKTKASLLVKQEERLKTGLKEQETKIQEMIKKPPSTGTQQNPRA
jgi:prefoldin beta subunit